MGTVLYFRRPSNTDSPVPAGDGCAGMHGRGVTRQARPGRAGEVECDW